MAINSFGSSTDVTFNNINSAIYSSLNAQEAKVQNTLNNVSTDADGNVSQTDLLKLQQELQQWTLMTDLLSTMTKQVGDSLKSIVQKAS